MVKHDAQKQKCFKKRDFSTTFSRTDEISSSRSKRKPGNICQIDQYLGENAKNWKIMAILLSFGRVYKCLSAEERFV